MPNSEDSASKGRFENFGRKVDEQVTSAIPRVEEELKKVIAYINDEVVPDVRVNSSRALRRAAETLAGLADSLDRNKGAR